MPHTLADPAPAKTGAFATAAALCAPLILFFLIQTGVSLAVLAIIGGLGTAALAGIGVASAISSTAISLLNGFDTGVQAAASRATGASAPQRAAQALADALPASAPLGAVLAALLYTFGPALVAAIAPDTRSAALGGENLRAFAPALFFLSLTIPFNAFWIGTGAARTTFVIALLLAPMQIALAWIFTASMGAAGAGLAGTLATTAGLVLHLVFAAFRARQIFAARPTLRGLGAIVRVGWPVSAQQSLLQFGIMIAYAIVSQLGASSTAILSVFVTLTTLPIQIAVGMGVACATLVGQALGRGDVRAARVWGWRIGAVGALITAPFGLCALLAPDALLAPFLADPAARALAHLPAQMLGAVVSIDAFARILDFALRGAGATKTATIVPFARQWLLQMPLMYLIGVRWGYGLLGIVALQAALTLLEAAIYVPIWRSDLWTRVRLADRPSPPRLPPNARRILVLGGAGAGKSTLARRIGAARGLPVAHLDRFMYGPDWTHRDSRDVRRLLSDALAGDAWVVDGVYPAFNDLTLARADAVIWIEQPVWLRLYRAWRKTRDHRHAPRADRPEDCEERFGPGYIATIFSFGGWSHALEKRLRAATDAPILHVKGDRALAALLTS